MMKGRKDEEAKWDNGAKWEFGEMGMGRNGKGPSRKGRLTITGISHTLNSRNKVCDTPLENMSVGVPKTGLALP
jgi:hypothetical protein